VSFRHVDTRRSRSRRGSLDDEVLQRAGQQRDTWPDPKRQSHFQRQRSGYEDNREDTPDEHQASALGLPLNVFVAQYFLSNGVGVFLFIRNSAVREIVFAQRGADRNIRYPKVSR
jgi:hypothetical protein